MYVKKILMCEFSSICLFLNLRHFFLLCFFPTNAMYSNLNSTKTIEQISLVQFFLYIAIVLSPVLDSYQFSIIMRVRVLK